MKDQNEHSNFTCTRGDDPNELKQWQKDLNYQMGVCMLVIGLLLVAISICAILSSK